MNYCIESLLIRDVTDSNFNVTQSDHPFVNQPNIY